MKQISLLTLSIILGFSLSGCKDECKPKLQTKYVYIKQPVPTLPKKPKARKYKTIMVNFEGVDYYAQTKADGAVMASNWKSYKIWAETNNKILKGLK